MSDPSPALACAWLTTTTEAERVADPETTAYHQGHGADLGRCDRWLCSCGNGDDAEGFDPVAPDGTCLDGEELTPEEILFRRLRCAVCGATFDLDGHWLGQTTPWPRSEVAA